MFVLPNMPKLAALRCWSTCEYERGCGFKLNNCSRVSVNDPRSSDIFISHRIYIPDVFYNNIIL